MEQQDSLATYSHPDTRQQQQWQQQQQRQQQQQQQQQLTDMSLRCPLYPQRWADSQQLWRDLKEKEHKYQHSIAAFRQHPRFDPRNRAILLSWHAEVCEGFGMRRETFYLSVEFVDRFFLHTQDIPMTHMQLAGTAALLLAAKMEEQKPPKGPSLACMSDGACTWDQLRSFELLMLQKLSWMLSPTTPHTWLQLYLQIAAVQSLTKTANSHHPDLITHQSDLVLHCPDPITHQSFIPHCPDPILHCSDPIPDQSDIIPHHPDPIPHHPDPMPHHPDSVPHKSDLIPHYPDPILQCLDPVSHHPNPTPHQSDLVPHHPDPILHQPTPLVTVGRHNTDSDTESEVVMEINDSGHCEEEGDDQLNDNGEEKENKAVGQHEHDPVPGGESVWKGQSRADRQTVRHGNGDWTTKQGQVCRETTNFLSVVCGNSRGLWSEGVRLVNVCNKPQDSAAHISEERSQKETNNSLQEYLLSLLNDGDQGGGTDFDAEANLEDTGFEDGGCYIDLHCNEEELDDGKKEEVEEEEIEEEEEEEVSILHPHYSLQAYVKSSQMLDLVVLDANSLRFPYSVLAAACVYHCVQCHNICVVTGLTWSEVSQCVEWMHIHRLIIMRSQQRHIWGMIPSRKDNSHLLQTSFVSMDMWTSAMNLSDQYFRSDQDCQTVRAYVRQELQKLESGQE